MHFHVKFIWFEFQILIVAYPLYPEVSCHHIHMHVNNMRDASSATATPCETVK